MSEPHALPEATRAAALAKVKAREDGIRAAAIKEGRSLERRDMLQTLGLQRLDEASQLTQLRAERDARPTAEEERKHVKAGYWRGFAIGGAITGAIVAIGAAWLSDRMIDSAFDAAGRIRAQSDMTDALVRSQEQYERNEGYTNPGQDVTRRP